MLFRTFSPSFISIPINILIFVSLDLGTPLKILIILITHNPGGISLNNLWILEILCILAPPQNFGARAHPMLPKINISLAKAQGFSSIIIVGNS